MGASATTVPPPATAERLDHVREHVGCYDGVQPGSIRVSEQEDGKSVVFQDVAVLGLVSSNSDASGQPRRYNKAHTIANLALYEGTQVGINHSFGMPSLDDLAGVLRGIYWDEAAEKVKARELVIRRTQRTEHPLEMIRAQPQHVGLSHDVSAEMRTVSPVGQEPPVRELFVTKVWSVDVVRHPATTKNLYESSDPPVVRMNLPLVPELARPISFGSGRACPTWIVEDQFGKRYAVLGGDSATLESIMTTKTDPPAPEPKVADLEARLREAETKLAAAEARADAAAAKLQEAERNRRIGESGLPDKAKERLKTALQGKTLEEVDRAISEERTYLESLGIKPAAAAGGTTPPAPSGQAKEGAAPPAASPPPPAGVVHAGDPPPPPTAGAGSAEVESEFLEMLGSSVFGLHGDQLAEFAGTAKENKS